MDLLELKELSLIIVLLIFVIAATVVWFAGTRLSGQADEIIKRTGVGQVAIGTLLLGGVTSLPEVATTITASAMGNAEIALNNLFGGVALQATLLVFGDFKLRDRSLSSTVRSPAIHLQGLVGILLLAVSAGIILVGDLAIGHVGVGSVIIFVLFVGGFIVINFLESIAWWNVDPDDRQSVRAVKRNAKVETHEGNTTFSELIRTKLFLRLVLSAAAVLVAGYVVVVSGEVISEKTGLGASVVGAILIALATSLPELSTTVASVRMGEYKLAFSNIFGTNILTIGLVALADVFFVKGPVLNEVDLFSVFSTMLGMVITATFLAGLAIGYRKTIFRLGYDSIIVAIIYLTGVFVMFTAFQG